MQEHCNVNKARDRAVFQSHNKAESTHKGNNQRSKYVTQVRQQRPESHRITLTWHACKYKVHKLHQSYILKLKGSSWAVGGGGGEGGGGGMKESLHTKHYGTFLKSSLLLDMFDRNLNYNPCKIKFLSSIFLSVPLSLSLCIISVL